MNKTILAAIFAIHNQGMPMPSREAIASAKRRGTSTLQGCVLLFGEQYMETNADEAMFLNAAKDWLRELKRMTDEKITATWPDVVRAYQEAN
jgi:hypothetical protein